MLLCDQKHAHSYPLTKASNSNNFINEQVSWLENQPQSDINFRSKLSGIANVLIFASL